MFPRLGVGEGGWIVKFHTGVSTPRFKPLTFNTHTFIPKKVYPFISYVPGSFENLMEQNNYL